MTLKTEKKHNVKRLINKFKEVNEMLDAHIVMIKLDLPELQGTPQEIIVAKAKEAARLLGDTVIVEDSCLCFNALNGLPGPYIKWFLERVGTKGLYDILSGFDDKSGYGICTFGYCEPGKEPFVFEGRTDGTIVAPRGEKGFGWDSIFRPQGYQQTYAEMDPAIKNTVSDRYQALKKLQAFFAKK